MGCQSGALVIDKGRNGKDTHFHRNPTLCRTVVDGVSFKMVSGTCTSKTYKAVLATASVQRTFGACGCRVLTALRDSIAVGNAAAPAVR